MRTRSPLLGTELHSDREPEVSGARITIQGTFPSEELFPAFVCCLPNRTAAIYPKNSGDDYFLVCDGVLYESRPMDEEFLRRADRFRGEGKGFNQVLSDTLRESTYLVGELEKHTVQA